MPKVSKWSFGFYKIILCRFITLLSGDFPHKIYLSLQLLLLKYPICFGGLFIMVLMSDHVTLAAHNTPAFIIFCK